MKLGILALQGAFIEHVNILQSMGVETVVARLPSDLEDIDGLIIPGGESTTISRLMRDFGLRQVVCDLAKKGVPIWGICAGLVLLGRDVANSDIETLGILDIGARRNAFGRQIDSFETELEIPELGQEPFHAVFIRGPIIEQMGHGVKVLAKLSDGKPVAVRQKMVLVCAFHPELTMDVRFHEYFLKMVDSG